MECYNFTSDYITEENDVVVIKKPIKNKKLKITVLINKQDLNNLVKLIPNVTKLELYFKDAYTKYDISPLTKLSHLSELTVRSIMEEFSMPRLTHMEELVSLDLNLLKIYKKKLDSAYPVYQWPKIKKIEFEHIKEISNFKGIVNYVFYFDDFKNYLEEIFNIEFDEDAEISDNFIVQCVGNKHYQLIFYCLDAVIGTYNRMFIKQLTKEQFLKFIFNKDNVDDYVDIPATWEDVFTDDE